MAFVSSQMTFKPLDTVQNGTQTFVPPQILTFPHKSWRGRTFVSASYFPPGQSFPCFYEHNPYCAVICSLHNFFLQLYICLAEHLLNFCWVIDECENLSFSLTQITAYLGYLQSLPRNSMLCLKSEPRLVFVRLFL